MSVNEAVGSSSLAVAAVDFVVIFAGSALIGVACALVTALVLRTLRSDGWTETRRARHDERHAEAARTLQLATLVCAVARRVRGTAAPTPRPVGSVLRPCA